jgi:cysteine desulfurase / selenocysteine lyase
VSGPLAPRDDFPAAREMTYLNAASIALSPETVKRAALGFETSIGGRGTEGFDDEAEARVYEGARAAGARLLGTDPACIAVTTSATEALGQVAWWLRPGAGTNVVSIDIEFPSVTYVWYRLAQESGVEVRLVQASRDPASLTLEDVAKLVDDRTAAVCVSHVQYATGHILDLGELSALAHAHDAVLVVDATQSAGMVPIDVAASDVDVLVSGGYKWLCASFGAALCYLRPELAERFVPTFVGWRSTVHPPAFDATRMPLATGPRAMEYSTVAYGSGIALGAAIEYLLGFGIDRILQHDLRLTARLEAGLRELGGDLLTPPEEDGRGSIVTARFPGHHAGRLADRLGERRVFTSPRLGGIRFSPHLYNDEDDVDRGLAELQRMLETPDGG